MNEPSIDTTSSSTSDPNGPDANNRADAFVAQLPRDTDPTRRETTWARLGMALMVIGVVVAVVAVILSQGSDNALDQSTQLTMAVAGLAATCFGAAVFLRYSLGRLLRFWLLRILAEAQGRGDRGRDR